MDATHVKARANNKKIQKRIAVKEALFYEEMLKKEIDSDRISHGRKPFSEKDDNDKKPPSAGEEKPKTIKCSISDPDSGWFHKGEHKQVFAYAVETACDKHGWILGYTVHPGNLHDSRTFKSLYDKIKNDDIKTLIMDSGYRTPRIAKLLIDDGIRPLFPYKSPMTKKGYFRKHEYIYDEYYDCYICPNNKILRYSTTNRDGYREYKSCGAVCKSCPYLEKCTQSKEYVKVIMRHVWEPYMEQCEDIRHTLGMHDLYKQRKETIERLFGTAKENHCFRYTQMFGKARMEMKVGLTFACLNLKKLAKMKQRMGVLNRSFWLFFWNISGLRKIQRKTALEIIF